MLFDQPIQTVAFGWIRSFSYRREGRGVGRAGGRAGGRDGGLGGLAMGCSGLGGGGLGFTWGG